MNPLSCWSSLQQLSGFLSKFNSLLTPYFLLRYSLFVILLAIPFFLPLINLIPNLRRFLIILFSDHFIQHRIEII